MGLENRTCVSGRAQKPEDFLRLPFPRAKLRRQIFESSKSLGEDLGAKKWAKNWTKLCGHFRALFAVQKDPPKVTPKVITPRSVAEISKSHLREVLGLGGPKTSRRL